MTTTPTTTAKPQGQWAVDGREPLNPNEVIKQEDDGLNVRERIETVYAKEGFASIPRERPERAPALVGPLHPAQAGHRRRQDRDARARGARGRVLHDARALRRRPPDAWSSCARIATISTEFARDTADISDRQNIQLPLDPHRGRARDLAAARGGRPVDRRGLRRLPARHPRLARGRASRSTRSSTARRRSTRSSRRHLARPAVLQPARASSSPRSAGRRSSTSRTRSTTSPSSASCTPSTGPASTCGSAAACRPTRSWPCGSAPGCRWTRSPDVWAGVISHLPRLRLPPAAHQGAAEVPRQGLGRRAVPPGARDGVPRPRR